MDYSSAEGVVEELETKLATACNNEGARKDDGDGCGVDVGIEDGCEGPGCESGRVARRSRDL